MAKGTVNKVIVLGRLGDDPEVRYTSKSGIPVARISIATTERFKKNGEYQEATEWHRCILWAGLAEVAKNYLKKGSKVYVEGRAETRSWEDKESGQTKYSRDVIVESLEMLGDPRSPEQKEEAAYAAAYGQGERVVVADHDTEDVSF